MSCTLTIRERLDSWAGRSPRRSTHETRAEAQAELLDYVRRNWDAEMGSQPPDDPDEIIEQYFSEMPESYDIDENPA